MDTTITSAYFLYVLCDPTTKIIRYVGITHNTQKRYGQHLNIPLLCDPKKRTHKDKWVCALHEKGLKPLLVIIDEGLTHADAKMREVDLIAAHKGLVNGTPGGDGLAWQLLSPEEQEEYKRKFIRTTQRALQRIKEEEPERHAAIREKQRQAVMNSEKLKADGRVKIRIMHEKRRVKGSSPKQMAAAMRNLAIAQERLVVDNYAALKKPHNVSEAGRAKMSATIRKTQAAMKLEGFSEKRMDTMRAAMKHASKIRKLKRLAFGDPLQPALF